MAASVTVRPGDDAVHADQTLEIRDGAVTVHEAVGGLGAGVVVAFVPLVRR